LYTRNMGKNEMKSMMSDRRKIFLKLFINL